MGGAIDKQTMLGLIIDAKRTDSETGSFAEWLAEYLAEHMPTLTPPNEWRGVEEGLPEIYLTKREITYRSSCAGLIQSTHSVRYSSETLGLMDGIRLKSPTGCRFLRRLTVALRR